MRRVLGGVAIVLVVLFVARSPDSAAVLGRHLGSALATTADGIGHFPAALTGGK